MTNNGHGIETDPRHRAQEYKKWIHTLFSIYVEERSHRWSFLWNLLSGNQRMLFSMEISRKINFIGPKSRIAIDEYLFRFSKIRKKEILNFLITWVGECFTVCNISTSCFLLIFRTTWWFSGNSLNMFFSPEKLHNSVIFEINQRERLECLIRFFVVVC